MKSRNHVAQMVAMAAALGARAAYTQEVAADSSDRLEEIVITAEKRESNLQNTPVAVEVVTPAELATEGVKDFTNIDKLLPTVQVFQGAGDVVISIRGLRSTSYDPTDESPNAVYLDGAYISRANALNGLLYDIQRVEVLAGPQGTLYGRNSASGAINIISNRPTSEFGGSGSIEAGDYNTLRFEAALNVPISDTLAMRFAGQEYQHDGYMKSGLDDARQVGGRFELLWHPDDRQSLLITADSERNDPMGLGTQIIGVNPSLQGANKFVVPSDIRDDTLFDGTEQLSRTNEHILGASAQYDFHFDPATLTVQLAHREFKQDLVAATSLSLQYQPAHSLTNSAEVRLTSNTTQPLQYVAGLYFFNEKADGHIQGFVSPTVLVENLLIDLEGQKTYSGAAFGQLTWTPAGLTALHLTAGGRYNYDRKSASSQEVIVPIVHFSSPYQTKDWNKVTWKAEAAYDLTPKNMVYADISTGYKSGGFTYGATPITPPQTITAYEVGSKNRFFQDTVQVNIEGYYYDYKNFEQTYLNTATFPFVLDVATAGSAKIYGADLSTIFALTRHDNVHVDMSYLHTQYGSFNLATIIGDPRAPNLTGDPLPDAPRWNGNGGYTHRFDVGLGTLSATVDIQYGDSRIVTLPAANSPQPVNQGQYTVEDASLRYDRGKWSATAYCNNFTNRTYIYAGAIDTGPGPTAGTTTANLSPPRTYGVIVSTSF